MVKQHELQKQTMVRHSYTKPERTIIARQHVTNSVLKSER